MYPVAFLCTCHKLVPQFSSRCFRQTRKTLQVASPQDPPPLAIAKSSFPSKGLQSITRKPQKGVNLSLEIPLQMARVLPLGGPLGAGFFEETAPNDMRPKMLDFGVRGSLVSRESDQSFLSSTAKREGRGLPFRGTSELPWQPLTRSKRHTHTLCQSLICVFVFAFLRWSCCFDSL